MYVHADESIRTKQTYYKGNKMEYTKLEELQSIFSDFHKDYYGYRPRFATTEEWNSKEWLQSRIDGIHDAITQRAKTPEGRAALLAEGWVINDNTKEELL